MPCYNPMQAVYLDEFTKNRKRKVKIVGRYLSVLVKSDIGKPGLILPCGQCVGCRLERSRQWAVRCYHESQSFINNYFITLTFSDEALLQRANPQSLDVRDFQLFMKKLRKKFGSGIRFFHCGEYGEQFGRPHYHAVLFNVNFTDLRRWKDIGGNTYYRSPALESLWPYGHSSVTNFTFETAAYVARYIMKKVNGDAALDYYFLGIDESTGEVLTRKPEYVTMSRKPGIGKRWFDEYKDRVYRRDAVVIRGKEVKPPKYYDSQFEIFSPNELALVKERRVARALLNKSDNTFFRLKDKEKCVQGRISNFLRRKL